MTGPRVLITGGKGFIGTALAQACHRIGWDVTLVSRTGRGGSPVEDCHVFNADVRDKDELRSALGDGSFDYVVNCAGYIDHAQRGKEAKGVFQAHFQGLLNTLDLLDWNSLRGFVQIGTSDEYGNAGAPQTEQMREAPFSPYSAAKTAATHYLQMLNRMEGFPGVVLRLFLVYGPGQDERRFIPQIMRGCLEGRRFETTEGEQLRDFCYIDDIVDGIIRALQSRDAHGEVINLGCGTPRTIRCVIDEIVSLTGRGKPVYGAREYRSGESMALYPDISKAYSLLDWKPATEFRDGLVETLDYYRTHSE